MNSVLCDGNDAILASISAGYAEENVMRNVYVVVRRVPAKYSLIVS